MGRWLDLSVQRPRKTSAGPFRGVPLHARAPRHTIRRTLAAASSQAGQWVLDELEPPTLQRARRLVEPARTKGGERDIPGAANRQANSSLLASRPFWIGAVVAACAAVVRVLSPWDRKAMLLALAIATLAFGACVLVTALSDEGDLSFRIRLGRAVLASPFCGVLGTWLSARVRRLRGEETALAAIGMSPARSALGPFAGGALLGLAAGLGVLTGALPEEAFYPHVRPAHHKVGWDERGFVDSDSGLILAHDGAAYPLQTMAENGTSSISGPTKKTPFRGAAGATLILISLAFSSLASRTWPGRAARLTLLFPAIILMAVLLVAFHAAASGRLGATGLVVPPLLFTVYALVRYTEPTWLLR